MARPKRMGAYNALDDRLPAGVWGAQGEAPPRRPAPSRHRALSALEDLLPGPSDPPDERQGPAPRRRAARRHLSAWNPLDELPRVLAPPTGTAPAKARVGFRLPAELVEAARDAVAHLAQTPDRTTLTSLAERALRAELARLAATHNRGRPFPSRPGKTSGLPAR